MTGQTVPIRVVLVDDHRLVREALRDALGRESDIEVVGDAGSAAAALQLTEALQPAVVVLDIALPDLNGIELAARLARQHPAPRIVALSGYTDKRFVTQMLGAGAAGYVTKSADGHELTRAIRAVAQGNDYLCPEVAHVLVSEVRSRALPGDRAPLGRREREVLRLIAEGRRSAEIAGTLHISVSTVEVHRRNIMRKLGLHTVADLTRHAVREGIVPP